MQYNVVFGYASANDEYDSNPNPNANANPKLMLILEAAASVLAVSHAEHNSAPTPYMCEPVYYCMLTVL